MSDVSIKCNTSTMDVLMLELNSLVESLDSCGQFIDSVVNLPEFPEQAFRLEVDNLATATGELVVCFYPTDLLLGFLATCRARYAEFVGVKHARHEENPLSLKTNDEDHPATAGD